MSAAYTDEHLENSQNGILSNYGAAIHDEGADAHHQRRLLARHPGRMAPRLRGGIDVNGDGDANDAFIVPQGFEAFNTVTERQRIGVNGSFQWKITDSLELTADGFFTRQNQHDHIAGVQQQDINWQAAEFVPGASRDTGTTIKGPDGGTYHLNTVQIYDYDLGDFFVLFPDNHYVSQSQDYNAELKWDDGRKVQADCAAASTARPTRITIRATPSFSPSNGEQWEPGGIGHYPDR